MRLIDVDKLVKTSIDTTDIPINKCLDVVLLEDLESAPTVGEWIPCSERMPDAEYGEGDSVLCCTELGLMYILYWDGGNWCVPTGEPHIWVNHKTGWHDRVIAWMPLPEPYNGGDDNDGNDLRDQQP